ncbi:hypothetical protein [Pseudomonas mangiferae]|uniref:DUF2059 domain-containing protein n=1 Tax=Pseudomonas mangiferae TaxID=2593654 RepID=A0A553GYG3_9PSED|nr:hypothetical protein [Pseudomonas mangiferae]TRX74546.1 hypothetical protein FM069_11085 [Pseudomonas mangiferae]
MRARTLLPLFLACAAVPALFASTTQAAPADDGYRRLFRLAGLELLCEQSAPLAQRGMPPAQQARLGEVFEAAALCQDLAAAVAARLPADQAQQAETLLDSPLAQRFTEAERSVGNGEGLATYRSQLDSRPPRPERLALVRRLDSAAHTTRLAALLRYEVGKTQALAALQARGEHLDEATLGARTAEQAQALQTSSAQAVESFMLYAYRQMPSDQVQAYAELYEQPAVTALLDASVASLPALFAARRARLAEPATP